jgi:hypothetical protein
MPNGDNARNPLESLRKGYPQTPKISGDSPDPSGDNAPATLLLREDSNLANEAKKLLRMRNEPAKVFEANVIAREHEDSPSIKREPANPVDVSHDSAPRHLRELARFRAVFTHSPNPRNTPDRRTRAPVLSP